MAEKLAKTDLEAGELNQKPEPAPAAAPAKIDKTPARPDPDLAVEQWFRAKIYNSPIARNTECWNYLRQALADLKQRLKGV
jgi:hypothetical protein